MRFSIFQDKKNTNYVLQSGNIDEAKLTRKSTINQTDVKVQPTGKWIERSSP